MVGKRQNTRYQPLACSLCNKILRSCMSFKHGIVKHRFIVTSVYVCGGGGGGGGEKEGKRVKNDRLRLFLFI